MTFPSLRALLDGLEDLSEFALGSPADLFDEDEQGAEWFLHGGDPVRAAWLLAEAEAALAYRAWSASRDAEGFAAYRAAADRAAAAQDALALQARAIA
jgi:hypothetical protein